jgi:hypothetical protein
MTIRPGQMTDKPVCRSRYRVKGEQKNEIGLNWAPKMRRLAKVEPCLPLESATAQEQEMKRTRKKHNAVIKAKGWWWRRSGGPDDRRVGE